MLSGLPADQGAWKNKNGIPGFGCIHSVHSVHSVLISSLEHCVPNVPSYDVIGASPMKSIKSGMDVDPASVEPGEHQCTITATIIGYLQEPKYNLMCTKSTVSNWFVSWFRSLRGTIKKQEKQSPHSAGLRACSMAFINCSSLRELMASRKASWDSNWSSTIWPATNHWKIWEKRCQIWCCLCISLPNLLSPLSICLRTCLGSPSIPVTWPTPMPSVTSSFWMDQVEAFVSTAWEPGAHVAHVARLFAGNIRNFQSRRWEIRWTIRWHMINMRKGKSMKSAHHWQPAMYLRSGWDKHVSYDGLSLLWQLESYCPYVDTLVRPLSQTN